MINFLNGILRIRVAIDFLKSYVTPQLYKKIDINSLQLTEKSFIVPQLREIHSDVIYKCLINEVPGYLFFLLEHQSTDDPLMAFRFLHAIVSLSYEHLKQGHSKLPIILPFCMYHGEKSPVEIMVTNRSHKEHAFRIYSKPGKLEELKPLEKHLVQ